MAKVNTMQSPLVEKAIRKTLNPDDALATGEGTFIFADGSSPEAKKMIAEIEEAGRSGNWALYREKLDAYHAKFETRRVTIHNKVVDRGTEMLARIVSADTTYTGAINYCALGTNATAGAAGDTQLGTETYRKLCTSRTYATNAAYISTFFTATEVSGTFSEVGHFVDGTASANTGRLFSRIGDPDTSELPVTKSTSETLTVDYKVTFTA